jgi:hypothetical protein
MMDEAGERASEIATLRAENGRLTADLLSTIKMVANQAHEIKGMRAALEPFVRAAGFHCIETQADESLQVLVKVAPGLSGALTVKDFRRARDACQIPAEETKLHR